MRRLLGETLLRLRQSSTASSISNSPACRSLAEWAEVQIAGCSESGLAQKQFWGSCFAFPRRQLSTGQSETGSAEASPLLSTPSVSDGNSGANPTYAEQVYGKTPSFHGIGRAGAKLRDIAMSEKKLNYFAKLIRRMHVEDALAQCSLQPKKAAGICAKVIRSAMANADNNHGLDRSRLMIDIINIGRGKKRYKMWENAKGRATRRNNHLSHMEIILKEADQRPRMKFQKPLLERLRQKDQAVGVPPLPKRVGKSSKGKRTANSAAPKSV